MGSFLSKLARLPPLGGAVPVPVPVPAPVLPADPVPAQASPAPSAPARPSLDELRERIARIVAKAPKQPPRADPTHSELPFLVEHTPHGPLYVRRERAVPAARVGRAPLVAARHADPAMLALLALDPSLGALDPKKALYVDTETTGLAGGTGTVPFLLGLAWLDDDGSFVVEQALLRRLGEEAPILALFAERVAAASMLVTFNGKAFDLPLLRTRYVMNRMTAPKEPPHLDLVHLARRIHRVRLQTRTLVAIEAEILGRVRVGDVAGGDIVATYAHFLRTGDEEALLGVVEHNVADVLAMVAMVGLYGEPLGREIIEGESEGEPSTPTYAPAILDGADLADVARTLRRAGALEMAAELAEAAVGRGGGSHAVRARGDIAKARGDKARALADYEALAAEIDDPTVRLELAKLYEHHVRAYKDALELLELGTGEDEAALGRRKQRLARKVEKAAAPPPPPKTRKKKARAALLPGMDEGAPPAAKAPRSGGSGGG